MDIATIIGFVTAFGLVFMAINLGGSLASFIDGVSMLIVVGGTLGATLINYPLADVIRSFKVGMKTFVSRVISPKEMIAQMIEFAQVVRKDGILALEDRMQDVDEAFLARALQMALDGQEPSVIEDMLYTEMDKLSDRHAAGAEVFSVMSGYAPAFGMIGTLVGLVLMLQNMSDPSTIGPSMSVALITTFYGALLANAMFLPMAGKLKRISKQELLTREIIIAGVQSLIAGENPRIMEQRLMGYLPPKERTTMFN